MSFTLTCNLLGGCRYLGGQQYNGGGGGGGAEKSLPQDGHGVANRSSTFGNGYQSTLGETLMVSLNVTRDIKD